MERDMVPWLEPQIEEETTEAKWSTRTNGNNNGDEHLTSLNSILEAEWYMNNIPPHSVEVIPNLQSQQQITIPSHSDPMRISSSSFLPNENMNNPFGNVFDFESKGDFVAPLIQGNQMDVVSAQTSPLPDFPTPTVLGFAPTGLDRLEPLPISRFTSTWLKEFDKSTQKGEEVNYDSNWNNIGANHFNANNNSNNINNNDNDNNIGGIEDLKGKKKEMPAKSLMAERRRRKKLSDRLYMLRSIVPKITKMDRASILGDAIDYMKELLQRINDLHSELESSSLVSTFPPSTTFHTMTPTTSTLPSMVKEERCPSNVSSPNNQSPKIEVRVREGKSFSIHMYCPQRPGVLLSTMRALDSLGLEVQQAVINSFNGFTLDVFKAEQCKEGHDVLPEQIKAVLLDTLSFHGMM